MSGRRILRRAAAVVFILSCAAAFSAADVRVGLYQKERPSEIEVRCAGGFVIADPGSSEKETVGGGAIRFWKDGNHVRFRTGWRPWSRSCASVRLTPVESSTPLVIRTPNGPEKEINGSVELRAATELTVVATLAEEVYVAAAAGAEIPADWPEASLRAQAVLARTYLERHRGRHAADGYDLCDLAHCQVFRGTGGNARFTDAALATRGQVLLADGRPIDALFHSTCGGHTAANQSVWPGQAPQRALQGISDEINGQPACAASPYFRWNATVSWEEIETVAASLEGAAAIGRLERISIAARDASGRVQTLRLAGQRGAVTISADQFYRAWGKARRWHELKSTNFNVTVTAAGFRFDGRGLGHGVGLCQYGAKQRADRGSDALSILLTYFPGATLSERR